MGVSERQHIGLRAKCTHGGIRQESPFRERKERLKAYRSKGAIDGHDIKTTRSQEGRAREE